MASDRFVERGGEQVLDLQDGDEGAGTYLAVRPHAEPGYFRPVCVVVPGEEEREIGDGVLGQEHAQDTVVKYAIQVIAREHGLSAAPREAGPDEPWEARTLARLWAILQQTPRGA